MKVVYLMFVVVALLGSCATGSGGGNGTAETRQGVPWVTLGGVFGREWKGFSLQEELLDEARVDRAVVARALRDAMKEGIDAEFARAVRNVRTGLDLYVLEERNTFDSRLIYGVDASNGRLIWKTWY